MWGGPRGTAAGTEEQLYLEPFSPGHKDSYMLFCYVSPSVKAT